MTENVLLDIQKTFDFFKATAASEHIDQVLLSGGASRVDGFAEALEDRFDTPVECSTRSGGRVRAAKFGVADPDGDRADRGGGRRASRSEGGRSMIRINLLAVDRERTPRRSRPC